MPPVMHAPQVSAGRLMPPCCRFQAPPLPIADPVNGAPTRSSLAADGACYAWPRLFRLAVAGDPLSSPSTDQVWEHRWSLASAEKAQKWRFLRQFCLFSAKQRDFRPFCVSFDWQEASISSSVVKGLSYNLQIYKDLGYSANCKREDAWPDYNGVILN